MQKWQLDRAMVSMVNVIPWGTTALDPLGQLPADFLPDKYPGNAPSIDSGAPPLAPIFHIILNLYGYFQQSFMT